MRPTRAWSRAVWSISDAGRALALAVRDSRSRGLAKGKTNEGRMAYDADDVVAKATTALETSVKSIIDCDDDEATKRQALAETLGQFAEYMERNVGKQRDDGDSVVSVVNHPVAQLARLLVAAGSYPDISS